MKKIIDLGLKTVYISGPMTGEENLNFEAFEKAENKIKSLGFEVFNPHKFEELQDEDFISKIQDLGQNETWAEYMKIDLVKMLKSCDFVLALNNWERSRGATIEIFLAKSLGLPVLSNETYEELNVTFKIDRIYG